jgi:hypothetical protein
MRKQTSINEPSLGLAAPLIHADNVFGIPRLCRGWLRAATCQRLRLEEVKTKCRRHRAIAPKCNSLVCWDAKPCPVSAASVQTNDSFTVQGFPLSHMSQINDLATSGFFIPHRFPPTDFGMLNRLQSKTHRAECVSWNRSAGLKGWASSFGWIPMSLRIAISEWRRLPNRRQKEGTFLWEIHF